MERNFKRISDELKLPQESRERIRFQLASHQKQLEDIPMKKRSHVPLIAAAVVTMMMLTLTAAAVVFVFRNDIIVSGIDDVPDIPISSNNNDDDDAPAVGGGNILAPTGNPPIPQEEMIEDYRFKSDDWPTGENINGGILPGYYEWDIVDVLSDEPSLRSRRISRTDGAEKMEYTAEDPANLIDTLTGRVTFDLEWLSENYNYTPDANLSFVVTDADGNYVGEWFDALYIKKDGGGYVDVAIKNTAQADNSEQSYIVDGSYETAYYYTSADDYKFLITMNNGNIWAACKMSHTEISLYGAYLTTDEVEDILDHLLLSIEER